MRKFKIAIFSGEIPPATFVNRLIIGLAERNTTILLIGHSKKKVVYANSNIKTVGYAGRLSKLWIFLKYSFLLQFSNSKDKKKLDQWINNNSKNRILSKIRFYPILYFQPDIFHLQWVKSIADWVWVKEFNIKLVVSLRGSHINYTPICEPKFGAIYKMFFPQVDGFHGVSATIVKEALQYKANQNKAKVVYSGLNLEEFTLEKTKIINSPLQIISVGRSHWVKGYRYALDAMRILKDNDIKFNYTIVGVEAEEELLFQRAQLDLIEEVVFEKSVPFYQVKERISNTDILLLSSLEEGIANVVLEAMALGTLVVSTNCGGMSEVIEHQKNGYLVATRSPQEIAQTIQKITTLSKEKYLEITRNAQTKIAENHTETRMIDDMLTLYTNVCESDK